MSPSRAEPIPSPLAVLKRAALFAGCDEAMLQALARACHSRRLAASEPLFHQGDDAEAAYVVATGLLAVVLTTADGRELIIGETRPGDCVGEVAVLTETPHATTAHAREPASVVAIPRAEFAARVLADGRVVRRLVDLLAAQLRSGIERERALAFLDAPTRLARVLLVLDRGSERGYLTVAQDELAQRIGATRQTTAKILGQWRRRGWIVTGRGRIVVLDRVALGKLSGEG